MTEVDTPLAGGRASTINKASAAIISQGIVAAASFALQGLALHELGFAGMADFITLSNGLILVAAAIHTGWVGDSLVVLDRHDLPIRRALFVTSAASAVISFVFGVVGSLIFTDLRFDAALLFGLALTAWLVEETGRRLMMARGEFVALVINDVIFAVGSLGLIVVVMVTSRLTMTWLVLSLLAGSVISIVAAAVQLPRSEFVVPSRGPVAFGKLASFAAWRSGQLTMRPLGMLLARQAVAVVLSKPALGLLDTGRLVIAPILTAANGFGGFSLPYFTARRDTHQLGMGIVYKFAAVSAAGAALYLPVALLLSPVFDKLSDDGAIPAGLIVSWCIYAAFYSANIPVVNALAAIQQSRVVFWGRCVDSVLIIALSAAMASAWGVEWVPVALMVGMVVGTAIPLLRLHRSNQLPRMGVPALDD